MIKKFSQNYNVFGHEIWRSKIHFHPEDRCFKDILFKRVFSRVAKIPPKLYFIGSLVN